MSSFFSELKRKRNISSVDEESRGEDDSFFSVLKRKRDISPIEMADEDAESTSGIESTNDRVMRGIKDIAGQSSVGLASGILGSYGNLSSLIGANPEEGYISPGEKSKYNIESEILERMNKPNYKPSISDIYSLSDDDISPQFSRLPTSETISKTIEEVGGPAQATTPEGGVARRASEIYGGGISLGVGGAIPAIAAGGAGEATKALGGGVLAQTVAEIITLLLTQGKSGNAFTSNNPSIRSKIKNLRDLGYSDKDINLAINAEKSASNRVKNAKPTAASEKGFDQALTKSEGLFSEVLEKSFPGYEKGTDYLHQAASDAYGEVARSAKKIKIRDSSRFDRTIENVTNNLRNTLGENEAAAPFLKRLQSASEAAQSMPTADTYINFYKELNSLGKWLNPKQKESFLTHVKNGIKSTFRNSGSEGRELAKRFEKVNKGIEKAYQAEEISSMIEKSISDGKIEWKKLSKSLQKSSNFEKAEKGLGKQQAKNLLEIARSASDISKFSKNLGSGKVGSTLDNWLSGGAFGSLVASLFLHSPKYAAVGLGLKAAASAGKDTYARLQTRLLTDVSFQNLVLKTLKAIKSGSPQALQRISPEDPEEDLG